MQIKKEKNGSFTITGMTLGKLMAIQHAFEITQERYGAYTAVKKDVHECINRTIKAETKPDKEVANARH